MQERSLLYVAQMRDGHRVVLDEQFPVDILDVHEEELGFAETVTVRGEAYVVEEELVLHVDLRAVAVLPCSICNEEVRVPLELKGVYHTEPLREIKRGVFDYSTAIREALLLEVPLFAECCQGHCPQRKVLASYLKGSE